ncbi:MAG: hypothetical protein AAF748_08075 [Pseudomonadota bacterium]
MSLRTRTLALLRPLASLVGVSAVLLAYSEFLFLNEEPVRVLLSAQQASASALFVAEMLALYMAAGLLLLALQAQLTSWGRVILVGALIGWAIEAAMVPAAYEAPPLSYLWTSVAWHGAVDVAFGVVAMRIALRGRLLMALIATLGLGIFWGVWAPWPWPETQLTTAEFALLVGVTCALLISGYALMDWGAAALPRWLFWPALAINGALWGLNAAGHVAAALGLAVMIRLTALALRHAPSKRALWPSRARRNKWRYGLILISGAVALGLYSTQHRGQPLVTAELAIFAVLICGSGWYAIALAQGLLAAWRRYR